MPLTIEYAKSNGVINRVILTLRFSYNIFSNMFYGAHIIYKRWVYYIHSCIMTYYLGVTPMLYRFNLSKNSKLGTVTHNDISQKLIF